jgi:hypothetical protein
LICVGVGRTEAELDAAEDELAGTVLVVLDRLAVVSFGWAFEHPANATAALRTAIATAALCCTRPRSVTRSTVAADRARPADIHAPADSQKPGR